MTSQTEILKQRVESHWPAFVLYARTWCDDPEDEVQEAWMRLMKEGRLPDTVAARTFKHQIAAPSVKFDLDLVFVRTVHAQRKTASANSC